VSSFRRATTLGISGKRHESIRGTRYDLYGDLATGNQPTSAHEQGVVQQVVLGATSEQRRRQLTPESIKLSVQRAQFRIVEGCICPARDESITKRRQYPQI